MANRLAYSRFLWGLLAWESAVFIPIAIVFARAGRKIRAEDLEIYAVVALFGVFVVAACAVIGSRVGRVAAVLLGIAVGVLCMLVGGTLWASSASGFEVRPAIFMGTLLLSVPSGIGGGIAGFLNQRALPSGKYLPPGK